MKKLSFILFLLFPLFSYARSRVTIIVWTDAVLAYNDCLKGVVDGIKSSGLIPAYMDQPEIYNCRGSRKECERIVRKTLNTTDVFISLGTIPTKTIVEIAKEKPVIFTIVGAPKKSGIVNDLSKPGGNITGISMKIPLSFQMKAIKEIVNPRSILIPYYPFPQAIATSREAKEEAEKLGIEVKLMAFTDEEPQVFLEKISEALSKVDALYLTTDPILYKPEYLGPAIKKALELGVPSFGIARRSVQLGAVLAICCDFYNIGYRVGPYLRMILEGVKPGDLPVQSPSSWRIYVNLRSARRLKLNIPRYYILSAEEVIY